MKCDCNVKLQFVGQLDRILGPLSEGAVTEGDWGSVLISVRHSLRPRFRSATSLREGGKAAAPQLPAKLEFDYGSAVTELSERVTIIAAPGTHCLWGGASRSESKYPIAGGNRSKNISPQTEI